MPHYQILRTKNKRVVKLSKITTNVKKRKEVGTKDMGEWLVLKHGEGCNMAMENNKERVQNSGV